jgi:hypothetical protein
MAGPVVSGRAASREALEAYINSSPSATKRLDFFSDMNYIPARQQM